MTDLTNLKGKVGAHKKKKRVARGTSSGHGKTGCRGHKGQKSRAGGTKGKRFEGGQTPLYRRLPKIGKFKNYPFMKQFNVVNLYELAKIGEAGTITAKYIIDKFFSSTVKASKLPVKILGSGKLEKPMTVEAHVFSKEAKEKIEASGGRAVVVK